MALTMWADQLNLHKGQSTSYHAKLEGLNGLPANAWTSPFYPTDLVDPSEWAGVGAGPSGPMRTGYLTFSITNQSAGVITMQNVFRTLDAKMFAPSGSLQVDGGVGAVRDGTFSILGLVRAYLQPMFAIGGSAPAANTSVATDTWLPPINWDSTRESPISTNCSASYTYRPDCMNAMEREAYNGVTGNHMSVPVDHVSDLDAAKKRYDEAKKKYEFYRGFGAAWGMWGRVYSAFQHGLKNLSKEDQDDYNKAADRLMHSSENKRHYDAEYQKNSSEYNQKMLEAFANDENEDREALERMKQYLIDQFNEKDKAEWQQAKDAADKWNAEREASESELHEAENELNKAYRAANTK